MKLAWFTTCGKHSKNQYNLKFLSEAAPATGDNWEFRTAENGMLVITNEQLTKAAIIMPIKPC